MEVLYTTLANESLTFNNWIYEEVNVNFSRMYYILDGEAYVIFNNQKMRLKKDHVYFFPAKQEYTIYDNPNCQLLHTYVHIITQPKITTLLEIEVEKDPFLQEGIKLLRKYIHDKHTLRITAIAKMIVSYVFDQRESNTAIAEDIKAFILANLTEPFSIEKICQRFNYSKMHINRIFQNAFNLPPYEYYLRQRLELGLKLLSEGESVKEVSYRLNYTSPSSFIKAFEKNFGASPSNYISILKIKED
jgi:AraC-like DNA-binding protein/mannose-6-phosphate isomerase-like protein (cupin superfamily)